MYSSELRTACSELYDDMIAFACSRLSNRWDAEDVVQTAMLRAWSSRRQIRDKQAIKGWLITIVRNEIVRLWSQRRALPDRSYEMDRIPADGPLPERWVEFGSFLQAISELAPIYRDSLLPYAIEGKTTREIARELGISINAVCTRNFRARRVLVDTLQESGEEDEI